MNEEQCRDSIKIPQVKKRVEEDVPHDQVVSLLTTILKTVEECKASIQENGKRISRLESLYEKLVQDKTGISIKKLFVKAVK